MTLYSPKPVMDKGVYQHQEKSFEEVNLPFDAISDEDYIEGQELYEALVSDEVDKALEDYYVTGRTRSDGRFEVVASNDSLTDSREPSHIVSEGVIQPQQPGNYFESRYSHLRVELVAPNQNAMDLLKDDLSSLEKGLEDHYRDNLAETNLAEGPVYTAD